MTAEASALERLARLEQHVHQQLGQHGRSGMVHQWQRHAAERIDALESQLNGKDGGFGIRTRVQILWHSYGWVIGLCGAVIGAALQKLFGG